MNETSVYCVPESAAADLGRSTKRTIAVLVLSLAAAVIFLAVDFLTPPPPDRLRDPVNGVIFGGLCVIPVFALIRLFKLRRTTRRVELGDQELTIFRGSGQRRLRYAHIGRVDVLDDSASSSQRRLALSLKDHRGLELTRIEDRLAGFEELTGELRRRTGLDAGRESAADFAAGDRAARIKQREKRSFINIFSSLVLLIMGLGYTVVSLYELNQDRSLRRDGVAAEATVIRHYIHNGLTHALEYQYTAGDGLTYRRDIMLPEMIWETLAEGSALPVVHLPDNGAASLFLLEEEKALGWPFALGVLLLLSGAAGFLMGLTGRDLEYIEGKFYWLRRGELVEDRLNRRP